MSAYPLDFVSLSDICTGLMIAASYATPQNFTGEVVHGYKAPKALMAKEPSLAICKVQSKAMGLGYKLKIFDAYRPAKAVAFFQEWALRPEINPHLKERYYPSFSRKELFDQGYIAKQSSHSRGSAVDLTLVDASSGKELDMGSDFDYFDTISNTDSSKITEDQRKNRKILKMLMEAEGFQNYSQEWWHFSFKAEPFPGQYFDFDVE
ncbi:MAG TPA: M15 family metallopeptidase [Bacteriovoracaceae bacterium]|nr:M15 family metallopeptidase [Bacteriovoracaceae bacterium]